MENFGLYIVMTNPLLGYETFTEICVQEEVPMLQIRDKHLSDKELLNLCKRLKAITEGSKTRFIVDDRPDICLLTKADGLHLGQDDLPWKEVIIFCHQHSSSVVLHNLKQAKELMESITAQKKQQKT
jgi:thiamine-phosphate pyrophosphorylase